MFLTIVLRQSSGNVAGLSKRLWQRGRNWILVSQLPWTVGTKELMEHFRQFGNLNRAAVEYDSKTGLSRCYGHVRFADEQGFNKALQFSNHIIDGRKVIVDFPRGRNFIPKTVDKFTVGSTVQPQISQSKATT